MRPERILACAAVVLATSGCEFVPIPGDGDPPTPHCAMGELSEAAMLSVQRDDADAPLADLSHYEARNAIRSSSAKLNAGACADNTAFRMGAGIGDVTGPAFDQGMAGYADIAQLSTGVLDRQHARAFVFESTCGDRVGRAVIVQVDIGLMFNSITQGVVERMEDDPELGSLYTMQNIVVSASHSHATAGGQAFHDLTNFFHGGHDEQSYASAVDGIVDAIRRAHANLARSAPGRILIDHSELLDGNVNRSVTSYRANASAERRAFRDTSGREVDTNRMMTLLRLEAGDGSPIGMLNWYAVHGTSISQLNTQLSGDNKGYAARRFESDFGTEYGADETFVAAFLQSDAGDASPNLFIPDLTELELRDREGDAFVHRGGGRDDLENAVISGFKQYHHARALFDAANEPLRGEVGVVHQLIDFRDIEVDAPRSYPSSLLPVDGLMRTCQGALGASFAGGAEDGRSFLAEGQTCWNVENFDEQVEQLVFNLGALLGGAVPPGIVQPIGCEGGLYDLFDFECQAEKPILIPLGLSPFDVTQAFQPQTLPLQIVVLGNLAIIALPWEVTTMAGRRIRMAVLDELEDAGVDYAVIAGYSNDYIHYLTTREEFAQQNYEGAATVFGPWSEEVVRQELTRLARSLRAREAPDSPYANDGFRSHRTSFVHSPERGDGNPSGAFGAVLEQPRAEYALSDEPVVVAARFVAGNPRNDLRRDASYVYVERHEGGAWRVIADDNDWATRFRFELDEVAGGQALVEWHVPAGTAPGRYRLRHVGASAHGPYSGTTNPFEITPCE